MKIRWLFGAILVFSFNAAHASKYPEPVINPHTDEILHSACRPQEFARLRAVTQHLAANRNPAQAWAVASSVLCASNAKAAKVIRQHTPALVSTEEFGTGESGALLRLQPRSTVMPLKGHAFGAGVEQEGGDLIFSHQPGGVCYDSFRLRYIRAAWLIVGTTSACD